MVYITWFQTINLRKNLLFRFVMITLHQRLVSNSKLSCGLPPFGRVPGLFFGLPTLRAGPLLAYCLHVAMDGLKSSFSTVSQDAA